MNITQRKSRFAPEFRSLASLPAALVRMVLDWQERASERRHVSGLDDHLLKDVGLTRADVETEARKPFWRV